MEAKIFSAFAGQQLVRCADLLQGKEKEYNFEAEDRFGSFKRAAAIQGVTQEQALVGMMTKHITSIYDMVNVGSAAFSKERWTEKITDSINYLVLLLGMAYDAIDEAERAKAEEVSTCA